jgi:hypothetical protein
MDTVQSRVLEWLANGEVGVSSKCMAMWLQFGKRVTGSAFGSHPHDPDDLNRCLKLLRCAPELRYSIKKMADISAEWAALVARWDEIEKSFIDEVGFDWSKSRSAKSTYELMKDVISNASKQKQEAQPCSS